MRHLLYSEATILGSLGLLILRLVMGLAFILHSLPKVENPTSWLPDSTLPGIVLVVAAFTELVGGIVLILGLLTRLSTVALGCVMIGAIQFHLEKGQPFVGPEKSYELAAVYLACCILFFLQGPGLFSVDAFLFRRRP